MNIRGTLLVCLAGVLTFAGPSFAQQPEVPRFTFNAGAGFTEPVRTTGPNADIGWNATAAAGVNVVSHVGLVGEFGFNDLGLSSRGLSLAGVPGGSMRVYSGTGELILRLNPRGRMDAYAIGGGGWYRRTLEFTAPTTTVTTFLDPFLGLLFPASVPANVVVGSMTQDKPGFNVGMGVSWRLSENSHAKLYAEARYHQIYTDPVRTTLVPVTFGLRW
jgi:hypothetical protein